MYAPNTCQTPVTWGPEAWQTSGQYPLLPSQTAPQASQSSISAAGLGDFPLPGRSASNPFSNLSYPPAFEQEKTTEPRKVMKVNLACCECRRTKSKCTGATPACSRCRDEGIECTYVQTQSQAAKWKMIVENPIQQLEAHLAKLFTDKFNELQIQILPPKPEEEEVEIQPHRFANIEIEIRAQKDHIQAKHKEALELEEKLSQLEAKHKRLLEELNQLEPKVEKLQKECPKLIAQNQHIEAKINLRFQQLNQLAPEAERLRIQQGLLLTRYDQINKLFKVHKKLRMESYSYTAPFNPYSNDFGTSASHNSSELKAAGRSYQTGSHASSSDWSSFNTPDFTQAQSFSGVADSSQHPGVMR